MADPHLGTTDVPAKVVDSSPLMTGGFDLHEREFHQHGVSEHLGAEIPRLVVVTERKGSFCSSVAGTTILMPRLRKKNRLTRIPSAQKSRTLHSRPPLYRFQEIFAAIKTGRYPNRTKLAQTIEVTTKTIQRDIDYMRHQMSVPIEFDYVRGGYYFTKPMAELPLFPLTEAELVSVFVAQKALEAYKGTAFEQPLRSAFQKLQAATGSANVSISWEDFHSAISFRHFDAYLPDATIFSELTKVIRNEEVVEFGYKKLDAKAYEKRKVEPWHLACVSGQWYLLGHDRIRRARRIFVLARMRRVSPTGQKFSDNVSSGIAFRSGKAKTRTLSKSSCGSAAGPLSSFANGTGILASRSRS